MLQNVKWAAFSYAVPVKIKMSYFMNFPFFSDTVGYKLNIIIGTMSCSYRVEKRMEDGLGMLFHLSKKRILKDDDNYAYMICVASESSPNDLLLLMRQVK